jgi:hypothetical protein
MLKSGDNALNFTLYTVDGQPVALNDAWRDGRNALLILLRHLG